MVKDLTIAAELRSSRGKNEAGRLRAQKKIPAVVYGTGKEPFAVSVNPSDVTRILGSARGSNTIFNLEITGGENTPVMLKDWQNHPLKGSLLHVDFLRIDLAKRLKVRVRVITTGEPRGVKEQGGVYEIINREIEIECLPQEIPEDFRVDVTEFRIGSNLRAADVPLTGSMKLVSSADQLISHVVIPAKEEEPEEAAATAEGATPAEPEVIKKGKKEEEESEGDEKKK